MSGQPLQGSSRSRTNKETLSAPNLTDQKDLSDATAQPKPQEVAKGVDGKDKSANATATEKATDKEKDPAVEKLLIKIEQNLEDGYSLLTNNNTLKNIKAHVVNDEEPDIELVIEGTKEIVKRISDATQALESLSKKLTGYSKNEKERIEKSIQKMYNKDAADIVIAIETIEKEQENLTIPPLKRFFYLGDITKKEELLKKSPDEIKDVINEWETMVNNERAFTLFDIPKTWKSFNDSFDTTFSRKRNG